MGYSVSAIFWSLISTRGNDLPDPHLYNVTSPDDNLPPSLLLAALPSARDRNEEEQLDQRDRSNRSLPVPDNHVQQAHTLCTDNKLDRWEGVLTR